MKKMLMLLLASAMMFSMVACGEKKEAIFTAGTYTAEAAGFGGQVKVTVTVSETEITEVTAEGANETVGIGSNAIEKLPAAIK